MKEIVIIGAGHGGIVAAAKLADYYNITLFERSSIKEIGYDFTDVFEIDCFKELNIDFDLKLYHRKDDMTFISPNLKNNLTPKIPKEYQEYRMERKEILKYLFTLLQNKNIKIIDNQEIIDFIIENDSVVGVIDNNGKQYQADLVIDSAGYSFNPRKRLFQNKLNENKRGSYLNAYRATFEKKAEAIDKYKVYLYPLGVKGIAWVVCLDKEVDVLIGSIEELSNDKKEQVLEFLQEENPSLGEKMIRGGKSYKIPINKPISRFFCKGYVVIGDGANMTIPLIGSGITNSIAAGEILANSILKYGLSLDAYWDYQYNYMIKRGFEDASLNFIKELLLDLDEKKVNFLFDKNIVKANDLLVCCAGRELKLKPYDFIKRAIRGILDIKLLLRFANAYRKSQKAIRIVKRMPALYNEIRINDYIKKYEKL